MKKFLSILMAVLVLMSLTCTAFADEFVSSVSYSPAPEIVGFEDENGETHLAVLLDADGNIVAYVDEDSLRVTSIAQILEGEDIHDDAQYLEDVYDGLKDGSIALPYESLGIDLSKYAMTVLNLFDISWTGEEIADPFASGYTLKICIRLDITADTQVYAMSKNTETGEWEPIANLENNGDGTVTCTFSHLCPVALAASTAIDEPTSTSEGGSLLWLWILIAALVACGVVFLVIFLMKKNKNKNNQK